MMRVGGSQRVRSGMPETGIRLFPFAVVRKILAPKPLHRRPLSHGPSVNCLYDVVSESAFTGRKKLALDIRSGSLLCRKRYDHRSVAACAIAGGGQVRGINADFFCVLPDSLGRRILLFDRNPVLMLWRAAINPRTQLSFPRRRPTPSLDGHALLRRP